MDGAPSLLRPRLSELKEIRQTACCIRRRMTTNTGSRPAIVPSAQFRMFPHCRSEG